MKVKQFIKQETVLSVAIVLAVISAVFVPPDAGYISYIDLRTLAILFSLMTVMAGLRRQGVFDRLGRALLGQTNSTLQLVLVRVHCQNRCAHHWYKPWWSWHSDCLNGKPDFLPTDCTRGAGR